MSDEWKIALTALATLIGGTVLFSLNQFIQRFLLDPIQEQAKSSGEVSFCLTYYSSWYGNPGPRSNKDQEDQLKAVSNALRECASRLEANTYAIWWYDFFEILGCVPRYSDVQKAIGNLIFISNSTFTSDREEIKEIRRQADEVRQLLRHKRSDYKKLNQPSGPSREGVV